MIVPAKDLRQAIKILELVPQRAGIPSSDYIRVEQRNGELEMALASEVVGRAWVKAKGQVEPFAIDRRLLSPFLLAGEEQKTQECELTDEKERWRIRQGNRKLELEKKKLGMSGYGKRLDVKGWKEVQIAPAAREELQIAATCSTADPSLPHLNAIYVKDGQVWATNTKLILSMATKLLADGPWPVTVAGLLKNELLERVALQGHTMVLEAANGYLEAQVPEMAQKKFPQVRLKEQLELAEKWPLVLEIDSKALAATVGRLQQYLVQIRREDWVLKLTGQSNRVRAQVKVQQGKFEELAGAEWKQEVEMEWPLDKIGPVLEYMGKTKQTVRVRVDEKKQTPYLIQAGRVRLMVGRSM